MPDHPLIIFDGLCGLCEKSVNFILAHDSQKVFRFAPAQSELGRQMLRSHHLHTDALQTVVLIESGRIYTQSTAVLRILRRLRRPEAWAMVAIPRPVRDLVYDWIARNRYRWFGRYDACQLAPE
jgi:predicted DCC family thiol-disulfide oxidoreductase YuxK